MYLNKKHLILFFTLLVVIFVFISDCGEKKPKVYHVGILSGAETFNDIADGFMAKMTDVGYENGKNIIYDYQKSVFDMVAYENIIKKLPDILCDKTKENN